MVLRLSLESNSIVVYLSNNNDVVVAMKAATDLVVEFNGAGNGLGKGESCAGRKGVNQDWTVKKKTKMTFINQYLSRLNGQSLMNDWGLILKGSRGMKLCKK